MKDQSSDMEIGVDRVIPRRLVESRERPDGCLELLAPRFQGFWFGWLQRWLPQDRAHQRVVLDDTGGRVWKYIDGTADIRGIAQSLAAADDDDPVEMIQRIWLFVRAMAAEGWLELRAPG